MRTRGSANLLSDISPVFFVANWMCGLAHWHCCERNAERLILQLSTSRQPISTSGEPGYTLDCFCSIQLSDSSEAGFEDVDSILHSGRRNRGPVLVRAEASILGWRVEAGLLAPEESTTCPVNCCVAWTRKQQRRIGTTSLRQGSREPFQPFDSGIAFSCLLKSLPGGRFVPGGLVFRICGSRMWLVSEAGYP